jgi:hypothetical protein
MDAQDLLSQLRDDNETALSRLGSSKGLYALTGGELDAPTIRAVARSEAETAARLFETWAESEDDEAAADLFAAAAEAERRHVETVDTDEGTVDADRPIYETMEGLDAGAERVGAFLARSLVAGKTAEQMVGFFVGNADPSTADTFRGLRSDIDDQRDSALAVLDELCETDEDWERANAAATAVLDTAYDFYVETLESMGVKPKNVC